MSYNSITLMGNLTRDPETRQIQGGNSITEAGIATNRKYKTDSGEQKEVVCFVDIKVWGKRGEAFAQYFSKGKGVLVSGELTYEQWDDKDTGAKRSKHSVTVNEFAFLPGGPGRSDEQGQAPQQPRQQTQSRATPPQRNTAAPTQNRSTTTRQPGPSSKPQQPQPPFGGEQQFKEEDIPFANNLPGRWV